MGTFVGIILKGLGLVFGVLILLTITGQFPDEWKPEWPTGPVPMTCDNCNNMPQDEPETAPPTDDDDEPARTGGSSACRALPDRNGTKFDKVRTISANASDARAIHIQFWNVDSAGVEYEALVEPGTYRVRSEFEDGEYGGTFWYYPPSCTMTQVTDETGLSPNRRNADGFDNVGRNPDAFDEMFEQIS